MSDLKPSKGTIALCSRKQLRLITVDEPKEVIYSDRIVTDIPHQIYGA